MKEDHIPTYCETRLDPLGITEEQNLWEIQDDSPSGKRDVRMFYPDNEDNMCITYLDLNGGQMMYESGTNKTEKPYIVKRLKNPTGKRKYKNPPNTPTRIYLTPGIAEKYQSQTPIDTLFIVEGQLKAFAAGLHGLDIVAISGIWNYKQPRKYELHDELQAILHVCQVKEVVLLFDADALQVEYEEGKDLAKRLQSFHGSVKRFRDLLLESTRPTWFMMLNEKFEEEAKGLDDLLIKEKGKEAAVIEQLYRKEVNGKFFAGLLLSAASDAQLRTWFRLGNVQQFYTHYSDIIQDKVFLWKRGRYRFDEESAKVKQERHPDADMYLRVGCEYFIKVEKVNSKGEVQEILQPWKKGEIKEDYVSNGICRQFMNQIPRFHTFCNVPDHSPEFQEVITTANGTKNFNLYQPIRHKPQEGEWPHIEKFLKHIFGEMEAPSGQPRCLMGYDYLSVMYRLPAEKLPILCLVSNERNTGKTTFLFFLKMLFGDNATICGNEDFNDTYNSSYASKLVICLDEGFIEKKAVLEKLKSMSTNQTVKLHGKFKDRSEIDFFGKFIITSNDEDRFIYIDHEEIRFWVLKVPALTTEGRDHTLMAKMRTEIPAFLHFLLNREITHEKSDRMWFKSKDLITPALLRVQKFSRPTLEKDIRDFVTDMMFDFGEREIAMPITEIMTAINPHNRFSRNYVKSILKDKMKFETPTKPTWRQIPYWFDEENRVKNYKRKQSRFYIFRAEDILSTAQQDALNEALLNDNDPGEPTTG